MQLEIIIVSYESCFMSASLVCVQWNLHNADTIGTLPNSPYQSARRGRILYTP